VVMVGEGKGIGATEEFIRDLGVKEPEGGLVTEVANAVDKVISVFPLRPSHGVDGLEYPGEEASWAGGRSAMLEEVFEVGDPRCRW
jgi:hypothetical protein